MSLLPHDRVELEKELERVEKQFGVGSLQTAEVLKKLGEVYGEISKPHKKKHALQRALTIYQFHVGEDDHNVTHIREELEAMGVTDLPVIKRTTGSELTADTINYGIHNLAAALSERWKGVPEERKQVCIYWFLFGLLHVFGSCLLSFLLIPTFRFTASLTHSLTLLLCVPHTASNSGRLCSSRQHRPAVPRNTGEYPQDGKGEALQRVVSNSERERSERGHCGAIEERYQQSPFKRTRHGRDSDRD